LSPFGADWRFLKEFDVNLEAGFNYFIARRSLQYRDAMVETARE